MPAAKPVLNFSMEPKSAPTKAAAVPDDGRRFISARIQATTFRRLKSYAGSKDMKLQEVIEQALTEYMANHPA